jgi:hypothetical protein
MSAIDLKAPLLKPSLQPKEINEQRMALCWLLRDRKWHRSDLVRQNFAFCLPPWEPQSVLLDRGIIPSEYLLKTVAVELLFDPVLSFLVSKRICRIRVSGGKQFIKLSRVTPHLRKLFQIHEAFEEQAWLMLKEGRVPSDINTPQELQLYLFHRPKPEGGNWRIQKVTARDVSAWFKPEIPLPPRFEPLFWFKAGFFSPSRMVDFAAEEVSVLTQASAKALLVDLFLGHVKSVPHRFVEQSDTDLAIWVFKTLTIPESLSATMEASLARFLARRARSQSKNLSSTETQTKASPRIDYVWIARRLKSEGLRPGRQSVNRALELACAMPIDQIQARVSELVAPPEEIFLRATGQM